MRYDYPIQVPIMVTSSEQLCAVYAVLANPNLSDAANVGLEVRGQQAVAPSTPYTDEKLRASAKAPEEPIEVEEPCEPDKPDEIEVDSDGAPFDESIHTGTKTKDGRWRMKKGATRPEPANPSLTTGSTSTGNVGGKTSSESGAAANENAGNSATDDEFAAFREAAAETPDPVQVPERTWTDADLGQLCNDAAVKLSDPAPVRALIAKFVPEGDVPHSRNIPNADREAFAQAIEEAAGIEYAG